MGFRAGVIDILGKLKFFGGANYVGIKAPTTISTSHELVLPPGPPSGTKALQIDGTGQISYYDPSSGQVTSVAIAVPAVLFVTPVSGSPITSAGTFDVQLAAQTANRIFAGPSSGASNSPSFRGLVVSDFTSLPTLDQWGAPINTISFNGQRASSLADPTAAQDAATKAYVDALSQGLDVKSSVRSGTLANITLSGLQTIDGIALVVGDRVLVKNQTTASENGIYLVQTGAWTRSLDADSSAKVSPGLYTFIEQGALNGDSGWFLTTDSPLTLGTTALAFTQFSGAGQIGAGTGMVKTGNTLDINTASSTRIVINADNIDLATIPGLTPGSYSQVAVDAYGRITTGSNPAFSKVARASFTNANLSAGLYTFTHNLGQQIINVQVSDNANKVLLPDEIILTSTTQATVDMNSYAGFTGTYNIVAVG